MIKTTIEAIKKDGEWVLVYLSFEKKLVESEVPAFLYDREDAGRHALVVLEWLRAREPLYCFESRATEFDWNRKGLALQIMWTPLAFDAVADLKAQWVREIYPAGASHDHCLISFEEISAGCTGYHCEPYGWLTEEAFKENIERDVYGIRARIAAGRVLGCG